jgi:hypothetical protein
MTLTPFHIKLITYGGAALVLWLLRPKPQREVTGNVELGVGTIDGEYGRDYYFVNRPPAPTPDNPAVDPKMHELIEQSNLFIAQEG